MAVTEASSPARDDGGTAPPPGRRPLVVGIGLHLLLTIPLGLSLVAFHRPHWHPIADLAQTELRVRDVGGRDSPLVGLAGRIGPWTDPGSHPGPLSFWAMAPVYRLLGSTALAFSAAALTLHLTAYAAILWIAHRRGGVRLMVVVAAATVLVARAYGAVVFLEPWNPYLPVLWWLVFLLALWSVVDDDPPMLVVAVVAGSFCAQTHLPYLGLVGASAAAAALVSAYWIWRGREGDPPGARARRVRFVVIAAVVGLVLWAPPLIDQVDGVGNLGRIRESLQEPDQPPVGVRRGAIEVVDRFGVDRWISTQDTAAAPGPADWDPLGLLTLAAWAASAVACWAGAVGPTALRRLHGVLATGIVLALVSSSRVSGELWYYLYLWCIGLAALCLVAIGWTLAQAIDDRLAAGSSRARWRRAATVTPAAVAVALALLLTAAAPGAEPSRPDLSDDLGDLADQTARALHSGAAAGGGDDGRYLVIWDDPVAIGSQGIGMVNELERAGFEVGVDQGQRVGGTRHRVMAPDEATAVVVVAVGPAIATWEQRGLDPGARVAEVDSRSPAQREDAEALATRIDEGLRAEGFDQLADEWRRSVFTAALTPGLSPDLSEDLLAYVDLRSPVAVFVVEPAELAG
ncbi:hypothetical protein HC251_11620 [Iamia sp. SCSIO 61187]|uniref:hypothetical protein n=1 Tax=Iamia sp. SCSIO 61187 TaxID=2722752 RepID=UPI001C62D26E|nr:hypothetical protein [Iamia sp. SCSIO 61187]QYG93016.1 hypothetical protein HC251_11620 [Iamia sp. SCSIO 61187]